MSFVHLHNHTEYSLLDGSSRIKTLVKKAKELSMPAVAITDHGNLYGVLDFYKQCKEQGIKPVIGCEVYVAPRSRKQKDAGFDDHQYHLVLLAENMVGYKNLIALVSQAYLEGFYYKPRVDKELLNAHAEGLIALSGCIAGEVPMLFLKNQRDRAEKAAKEYIEIFGKNNFYLELQDHGMTEEASVLPELISLGKKLDIGLVASNDTHYVDKKNSRVHDILLCIQTAKTVHDEQRLKFPTDEFYLKTDHEMKLLFGEVPEALTNTLAIAERCNLDFSFGEFHLPDYGLPEDYKDASSYLRSLCMKGLQDRYENAGEEIHQRLNYELSIIERMNFPGYFLIVWDLVHFAVKNGILVGPGRGSAAGSLVAYVLGITNIDPLKYDLLFERFLNPERITMPDIDIDFCYERRGEVIDYLAKKYGQSRVAQIITFGTMAAKAAVRDVGRVLQIPLPDVDKIAKLIPTEIGITLEKAIKNSKELKGLYEENSSVKELLDIAKEVEGLPRHASTHAAGVVISKEVMTSYLPVQRIQDGSVTTQFPMNIVEEIGLLKMDILGLRTLTVIGKAVKLIKENQRHEVNIEQIPLEDLKTYEMLGHGDSMGVFQLESEGMRTILRNLKPDRFSDLIALVALYRPGPLGSGMVDDFIKRRHGETPDRYIHPSLEPILKDTYGVILYQEQVMRIASELAGFTLGQADLLRRAMGKKKPEIIAQQKELFMQGCSSNGIEPSIAEEIFDLMAFFAGYGFNKSHSAAYALVAYQTAYLKANYPTEYMAALLSSIMGNTDKCIIYIEECKHLGIEIIPPDVNESHVDFSVEGNRIRFGLAAVKNVGEGAIRGIINARDEKGSFKDIVDFCCRVEHSCLNKRVLESLIRAGAFRSLGTARSQLLAVLDQAIEIGLRAQDDLQSGQLSLFDLSGEDFTREIKMPILPEFEKKEILVMEKETLGLYLSGHPLDEYRANLLGHVTHFIDSLRQELDGNSVTIGGAVVKVKRTVTRRGDAMAYLTIEDHTGTMECLVFPSVLSQYAMYVLEDHVVKVYGRVNLQNDELKLIANRIEPLEKDATHSLRILLKGDELKEKMLLLRKILQKYQGNTPVYLEFVSEGKSLLVDRLLWISTESEIEQELSHAGLSFKFI